MNKCWRVYLEPLGCAKNQVDGEMMLGLLIEAGFLPVSTPYDAEIIIVNTCGFIDDAKKESIDAILNLSVYKRQGKCRVLIATGCLVERYQRELAEELPEVDAFLGVKRYHHIVAVINNLLALAEAAVPANLDACYLKRYLEIGTRSAYLKVAEGCDNRCAYCAIPLIRGRLHSRPLESLLAEAAVLKERGVCELIVIAQDTTAYGLDIYGRPALPELLKALSALDFTWIRVLYCYPTGISSELIESWSSYPTICHYLDIPIQHVAPRVLSAMCRRGNEEQLRHLIADIKKKMPDVMLRTTLMVGFPGETEEDFEQLYRFVAEGLFDWVGVFTYSEQEGTLAATLVDDVPEELKEKRRERLISLSARLIARRLQRFSGQKLTVLLEEKIDGEDNLWAGRSCYQAPEVDGRIYVRGGNLLLKEGQFVQALITGSDIYDLSGEVINNEFSE